MMVHCGGWTLLTLLTLTKWVACYGSGGQRADKGLRHTDQDDLIFTGPHLSWATTHKTVVSCATACMSDQQCVSFTTTKTSAGKVECRGHSGHPTERGVERQGSRLYVLRSRTQTTPTVCPSTSPPPPPNTTALIVVDSTQARWLNTVCSENDDCKEDNTVCFNGNCLCIPGYFYSMSSHICLTSCAPADLQDEFLSYPGYFLLNHNIPGGPIYDVTEEQCQTFCLNTSLSCPSAEYRYSDNGCWRNDVSRIDAPEDDWIADDDCVYFQRTCR